MTEHENDTVKPETDPPAKDARAWVNGGGRAPVAAARDHDRG